MKPTIRLTDTVQVGRIETLEDVLRMLSSLRDLEAGLSASPADAGRSLEDLSPAHKRLYGITQFRVNEAIRKQKTKQEPKGRIMP